MPKPGETWAFLFDLSKSRSHKPLWLFFLSAKQAGSHSRKRMVSGLLILHYSRFARESAGVILRIWAACKILQSIPLGRPYEVTPALKTEQGYYFLYRL